MVCLLLPLVLALIPSLDDHVVFFLLVRQASAGATVHTIAHNLNNGFVDVGVQVERSNGKYYNDIVSVEEQDNNTVKVYLSTALKVKVICRSAAAL